MKLNKIKDHSTGKKKARPSPYGQILNLDNQGVPTFRKAN
tara:strand:- start:64 stop:183 length:120 start_codon:yes stop_codon:yes gene_type:complete